MKKQKILELLAEARSKSTFEKASFYSDDSQNKEIIERTKLYRESWIIYPLDEAIRLIKEGK